MALYTGATLPPAVIYWTLSDKVIQQEFAVQFVRPPPSR